jgi:hypothetical protein
LGLARIILNFNNVAIISYVALCEGFANHLTTSGYRYRLRLQLRKQLHVRRAWKAAQHGANPFRVVTKARKLVHTHFAELCFCVVNLTGIIFVKAVLTFASAGIRMVEYIRWTPSGLSTKVVAKVPGIGLAIATFAIREGSDCDGEVSEKSSDLDLHACNNGGGLSSVRM